jgi:hypothetical protein
MMEKMINSFIILLTEATPVTQLEPRLLRLSTMRILPKAIAHKKKAMREGAFTFRFSKRKNYAHLIVT